MYLGPATCTSSSFAKKRRVIMLRKLAMSLAAAALILAGAFWSINADAGVQYHGGPKSADTVSVGAN